MSEIGIDDYRNKTVEVCIHIKAIARNIREQVHGFSRVDLELVTKRISAIVTNGVTGRIGSKDLLKVVDSIVRLCASYLWVDGHEVDWQYRNFVKRLPRLVVVELRKTRQLSQEIKEWSPAKIAEYIEELLTKGSIFSEPGSVESFGILSASAQRTSGSSREAMLSEQIRQLQILLARSVTIEEGDCHITKTCVDVCPADHAGVKTECEVWEISGLPYTIEKRYYKPATWKLFCRPCYPNIYDIIKSNLRAPDDETIRNMLVKGIPGIGKSMFSIYFLLRALTDADFPKVKLVIEYAPEQIYHCIVVGNVERTEYDLKFRLNLIPGREILNDRSALLLSDYTEPQGSFSSSRWKCIFSSPNSKRYKYHVKETDLTLTMPVWSVDELMELPKVNKEHLRKAYIRCGGVARFILYSETKYLGVLETAVSGKGVELMKKILETGFDHIESIMNYSMIHINPPTINEAPWWNYSGKVIKRFASTYVRKRLFRIHLKACVATATGLFDHGTARYTIGPVTSGHLFERLILWDASIHGVDLDFQFLQEKPTASAQTRVINFPRRKLVAANQLTNLTHGVTYQPKSRCFESGDAFCLVPDDGGKFILVVLQVTIAKDHPIKEKGLRDILSMFSGDIRKQISQHYVAFVTDCDSELNTTQYFHTPARQKVEENSWVHCFKQLVYRHSFTHTQK